MCGWCVDDGKDEGGGGAESEEKVELGFRSVLGLGDHFLHIVWIAQSLPHDDS